METFTHSKTIRENPQYPAQRRKWLDDLHDEMLDAPIVDLIHRFNRLPHCFTLQSCYGHFVHEGQTDIHNLDPLPKKESPRMVEYRIAYIAFCIENNVSGKKLFGKLKEMATIDPKNIQFGCAEWFWKKQINSFVLQVEPDRFKCKDKALLDFKEALQIEGLRNTLFVRLYKLLENIKKENTTNMAGSAAVK